MVQSNTLPLILAGPILRRVEVTRVCVWIATSKAVRVTGLIYNAAATEQLGQGNTETIAFGEALHIAVVEITPLPTAASSLPKNAPGFETRKVLAYDLVLEILGKDGKTLAKHLLSKLTSSEGGNVLAYAPHSYPTFFIDDVSLNILHGSCRKPNGSGGDALACADMLLQSTVREDSLKNRPSALFLTGDQIYADEVHDELITPIAQLGRQLLGFDETIPTLPTPVHLLDPKDRGRLAETFFSPHEGAENQMFGFGEFAGLYLLSLNQELWFDSLTEPKSRDLRIFRKRLPAVRRALANIATYMIFDDHDVTDDWNMSKAWEDRSLRSRPGSIGRRVIANALCAYWAFQGWGNKPEAFDDAFRNTITDYFANDGQNGSAFEALLLDTHPWSFVAPTTPPAFFLDCRTRRASSTMRDDAPSALMDDSALQDFHTEASARQLSGKWLVVIAQTPVLGVPDDERYIEAERHGFRDPEQYDNERWHSNRTGYSKLLRELHTLKPRGCIILSGDLHYGFVVRATVTVNETTVLVTQFTSSALKNATRGETSLGVFAAEISLRLSAIWNKKNSLEELGWMSQPQYTQTHLSKRLHEILALAPTVLTHKEFTQAKVITKSDTKISKRVMHSSIPAGGPFLHRQTNLGHLMLSPSGDAMLCYYGADSARPFATYTLRLDDPM